MQSHAVDRNGTVTQRVGVNAEADIERAAAGEPTGDARWWLLVVVSIYAWW